MSKLIIWDIDGTLMHCYGGGREALEKAYHLLYQVEDAMQAVSLTGVVDHQVVTFINQREGLNAFDPDRFYQTYAEELAKVLKTGKGITVIAGIEKTLASLQKPGLYHCIGTGNCRAGAQVKMTMSGLSQYFECGAYGDEVNDRDELIALAKARAEEAFKITFSADEVMVIGDTPSDILSAKAHDYVAVATTTGYYDEGTLAKHHPDYMIDHFDELYGILFNQWPKGF